MLNGFVEAVRQHDPDRFFTALFAPADKRDALLALYEFNHELARARAMVSEPHLALIRLHWWREVLEGTAKRHPLAEALSRCLDDGSLDAGDLMGLIDAREVEAEAEIATVSDWFWYLMNSAGGLTAAAARLLGAEGPDALRPLGAAYGVAEILRATPALARQGRCLLPADVLAEYGLSPAGVVSGEDAAPAIRDLAAKGLALLRPERLGRRAIAAALPAVLARRDLLRLRATAAGPGPGRGIGDKLSVAWAAWRGRVG